LINKNVLTRYFALLICSLLSFLCGYILTDYIRLLLNHKVSLVALIGELIIASVLVYWAIMRDKKFKVVTCLVLLLITLFISSIHVLIMNGSWGGENWQELIFSGIFMFAWLYMLLAYIGFLIVMKRVSFSDIRY